MGNFVPVVAGSRGKRGFEFASTKRLVELLKRYRALRNASDASPALRAYSRGVLSELHDELAKRNTATSGLVQLAAAGTTA